MPTVVYEHVAPDINALGGGATVNNPVGGRITLSNAAFTDAFGRVVPGRAQIVLYHEFGHYVSPDPQSALNLAPWQRALEETLANIRGANLPGAPREELLRLAGQ
jgi:hypothetical protein